MNIRDKIYLTFSEAALYSGIPHKHLRQLIDEGRLQEHEMGRHGKGTKHRIRRTDLDKL